VKAYEMVPVYVPAVWADETSKALVTVTESVPVPVPAVVFQRL
jgi:hypothetical protein